MPSRTGPLVVLATAQFLVVLSTSIVNVALPAIRTGLGLDPAGLSWVVNAYGLAFGALLLPGGRLADLAGRRRVLRAGLAIFTASALVAALAWSPAVLIGARAAQGVGAALLAPAALALVLTHYPQPAARGRALGVWGAVSGAGGAAGVLLSGVLTELGGWRSIFVLIGVAGVVTVLAVPKVVPVDQPGNGGRLDVLGTVSVTGGLVALTYGLAASGVARWVGLAVGAGLLAVFVLAQRRVAEPLVAPRVVRIRSVRLANLVMLVLGGLWVGLFFFLPLYQQQVLGYSALVAGLTQLPLAGAIILGSAVAGWVGRAGQARSGEPAALTGSDSPATLARSDRPAARLGRGVSVTLARIGGGGARAGSRSSGPRAGLRAWAAPALLPAALALVTVGLLWFGRAPANGEFLPDLLGPSLLTGLGLGLAFVQLTAVASANVPATDTGLASGLINTTRQVGGALGLAGLTALGEDFGLIFTAAAGIGALALLLSLVPAGTRR
ncbi:MFS transporter [Crossiella sp. CA-258035]|uniref:MFS transporter n=1 Tax=Crossiella sp. CA-258035 TaxID=2981138 RepID=UPI0024BCC671|nr:MFS transporter [Crossiella sp. CA-258035]WHT16408.1 MFS transporter [Crossiella sp. CA-258035]